MKKEEEPENKMKEDLIDESIDDEYGISLYS